MKTRRGKGIQVVWEKFCGVGESWYGDCCGGVMEMKNTIDEMMTPKVKQPKPTKEELAGRIQSKAKKDIEAIKGQKHPEETEHRMISVVEKRMEKEINELYG